MPDPRINEHCPKNGKQRNHPDYGEEQNNNRCILMVALWLIYFVGGWSLIWWSSSAFINWAVG